MKKMYLTPAMQEYDALVASIVAESLPIGKTTVSGDDALIKDNPWEIWGDEEIDADE